MLQVKSGYHFPVCEPGYTSFYNNNNVNLTLPKMLLYKQPFRKHRTDRREDKTL